MTVTLLQLHALTIIGLIMEESPTNFKDLGKYLLGGFVLALGAGITFTVVRMRLRDRKAAVPSFISIRDVKEK